MKSLPSRMKPGLTEFAKLRFSDLTLFRIWKLGSQESALATICCRGRVRPRHGCLQRYLLFPKQLLEINHPERGGGMERVEAKHGPPGGRCVLANVKCVEFRVFRRDVEHAL